MIRYQISEFWMITFLGLITAWCTMKTHDRATLVKNTSNVECSGQNIIKHLFI